MISALNTSDSIRVTQIVPLTKQNDETEKNPLIINGSQNNSQKLASQIQVNEKKNIKQAFELTAEEKKMVQKLKARDAEVRRHEMSHKRVGGQYAGQISYTYQTGPDSRQYAIGGSIKIDDSEVPNNPEATIKKMEVIIKTALAPAKPSQTDRRVAADARQEIMESRMELQQEKQKENAEKLKDEESKPSDLSNSPFSNPFGKNYMKNNPYITNAYQRQNYSLNNTISRQHNISLQA